MLGLYVGALGLSAGWALATSNSEDPDWIRFLYLVVLLFAIETVFGIAVIALTAAYRLLRSSFGTTESDVAPQDDGVGKLIRISTTDRKSQSSVGRSRWSTASALFALISIVGTVVSMWPYFPANTVLGVLFATPAAIFGLRALRVGEDAARGALALVLFSVWLQALMWIMYLVPILF